MSQNEALLQEKYILELQNKKRNQRDLQAGIEPLRKANKIQKEKALTNSKPLSHFVQNRQQQCDNLTIHERLHREACQKNQQLVINDVIKEREEMKDCTFKPNASQGIQSSQWLATVQTPMNQSTKKRNSSVREDPFLYERLSKSVKKFNPEVLQLQQEADEMKDCTFKPQTNGKSQKLISREDYSNKDQFYERLYREGENKERYKQNLQLLKDTVETSGCTFQPQINTTRSVSVTRSSQKKDSSFLNDDNPFDRLHQEFEHKQREKVKMESDYDKKFQEKHPFQPTRITKQKDQSLLGQRHETSQQRASRMYEQWREREKKIEEKRKELMKEEENLCKLTLCTNSRQRRPSVEGMSANRSKSQMGDFTNSQISNQSQTHDRLYQQGLDKQKKQNELRTKVYKESGYSFQPKLNNEANQKYVQSKQDIIERNKEFIEKKQNHIKMIESQTKCDFKPSRVTKQSKLAKEWEKDEDLDPKKLGDKLFQKQSEIESKKEVLRQKLSKDENCTFQPKIAKNTDKILKESSTTRQKSLYQNNSSKNLLPLRNATNLKAE